MHTRNTPPQKGGFLTQYEAVKQRLHEVTHTSRGAVPLSPRPRMPRPSLSQFDYLMKEDKALVNAFRDFLVCCQTKEYAQENLDFYRAILKFHGRPCIESARRIVDTFINPSSDRQVNVDADTRDSCMEAAAAAEQSGEIPAHVFDHAQEYVGGLIKNGAWPRFLNSPEYEQYRLHVEALQGPPPTRDEPPSRMLMWLLTHLTDSKGEQFDAFMKSIHSHELVLFWTKCNELLNIQSPGRRRRTAEKVYERYLKADAACEVNIASKHRAAVEAEIQRGEEIGPAFEEAMAAVFMLILNGPFLIFLQTENPFDKSEISGASEMFLHAGPGPGPGPLQLATLSSRSRSAPNSPQILRGGADPSPFSPRLVSHHQDDLVREITELREKVRQHERTIELLSGRLNEVSPNDPLQSSPSRRSSKPHSPKSPLFSWRKNSTGSAASTHSSKPTESPERRGSLSSAMESLSRIRIRSPSKRDSLSQSMPPGPVGPRRPGPLALHGPFGVDDGSYPDMAGQNAGLDQIDELISAAIHSPRVTPADEAHSAAPPFK